MGLSRDQIEEVKKEAEKYKAATGQVGQALTTLWQARIDVAIAAGEAETVEDLLKPPEVALWDNKNCDCSARWEPGTEVMEPKGNIKR